jgi:hypothetical protein
LGSAIGQYSCTNLLKELEAVDTESEEDNVMLFAVDREHRDEEWLPCSTIWPL